MSRFDEARKAKVKAVNAVNKKAMEVWDEMTPIFAPLVGEKIYKADGSLLAKIKKLIPEQLNTHNLSVFLNSSDYSLGWTIKACEHIQDTEGCLYYDVTSYIGNVQNGVLTDLQEKPKYKADWTEQEVKAMREDCKAKKKAYDDAKSALHPFGEEYDN